MVGRGTVIIAITFALAMVLTVAVLVRMLQNTDDT